jgi:hypothetical protein
MSNPAPVYAVTVGIDWADLKHDIFERHSDRSLHQQQISSPAQAVNNWLFELRTIAEHKVSNDFQSARELWN